MQARPETRWNAELDEHPHTIFMRRKEVLPEAAAMGEVLLSGYGASRGAGQGTVRFLRSALELNRIHPGDILAAERTDPDMVPGMRVASAIIANVGGDTSHAAISSRELGIAAVIDESGISSYLIDHDLSIWSGQGTTQLTDAQRAEVRALWEAAMEQSEETSDSFLGVELIRVDGVWTVDEATLWDALDSGLGL